MMDELKQQFYEVMHKYQKPFSEEGVTANLAQWYEQKQRLLQLLRKHPLWNEKELAIVFRVEERREIDRITVDETRAAILELAHRACKDDSSYEKFETALRAATADYARIPKEYRLDTIRQYQQKGLYLAVLSSPGGVHKSTIPDIIFEINKPLLIFGHSQIGLSVIIGKADEVAGVCIMEADFAGEAAYIGNFQQGMKIILHSTDFKRFVHGGLLRFYLLCPL